MSLSLSLSHFNKMMVSKLCLWLLLHFLAPFVPAASALFDPSHPLRDIRKLQVGKELFREQLALQKGQCIYEIEGLEPSKSYEVKVSYPASIPATFSISLLKEEAVKANSGGRRLLNTEKLMFKADTSQGAQVLGKKAVARVQIAVEPAGVIAKRDATEQPFIIYNILCEEVWYSVPLQAFWIVVLAVVALGASAVAPAFLPLRLLPRKSIKQSSQ